MINMNDSTKGSSSLASIGDQLVIKAQLGDDIRKVILSHEALTLNELFLTMKRIFADKTSNSDDLIIKYRDDDGDQITLATDSDLRVALHFHQKLRLFVYVHEKGSTVKKDTKKSKESGTFIDAYSFAHDLKEIRNSVQTILDRCDIPRESTKDRETEEAPPSSSAVSSTVSRELDTYPSVLQRSRSNTPNSVRSRITYPHKSNPIGQTTSTASSEPLETKKPSITPFQAAFPPGPHLIPSGVNSPLSKPTSPSTPPPSNPNIPLYATRAFPSRQTASNAPPSSSSPVAQFIGQAPSSLYDQQSAFQQKPLLIPNSTMNPTAPSHPPSSSFYTPTQSYFKPS